VGLLDGAVDGELDVLLYLSTHDGQEASLVQLEWVCVWVYGQGRMV
jgi:hypothetical protein